MQPVCQASDKLKICAHPTNTQALLLLIATRHGRRQRGARVGNRPPLDLFGPPLETVRPH